MLDHVSVGVADLAVAQAFYDVVLAPLGVTRLHDGGDFCGYGRDQPKFWLHTESEAGAIDPGFHVAFGATERLAVDAFHAAALAAGAVDNGAPGPRPHYHDRYYGAFVITPDGHRIEAVCHD